MQGLNHFIMIPFVDSHIFRSHFTIYFNLCVHVLVRGYKASGTCILMCTQLAGCVRLLVGHIISQKFTIPVTGLVLI